MLSAQQFLLFFVVGISTTIVDFGIFNLLTSKAVGWRRIPANTISVAVAMTWSFLGNWFIVFRPEGYDWIPRAERFLVTTAFSAFVLQNAILYLTTYVWKGPVNFVLLLVRRLPMQRPISSDVISRNTCKAFAVAAGLIWNFCWYKFFVYVR